MKNYSAKNVDEYIASAPGDAQAKLEEVRAVIQASVPNTNESISWGIPFYACQGLLAGFSACKSCVLFGLAFALQDEDREKLEKRGCATGKKTVQIKFDQKIPVALIRQMLKARAKTNESKRATE